MSGKWRMATGLRKLRKLGIVAAVLGVAFGALLTYLLRGGFRQFEIETYRVPPAAFTNWDDVLRHPRDIGFGQLENHLRIYVDPHADTPATLAVGVVNAQMLNFTFRAHAEYFNEPIAASRGVLLTRVASADVARVAVRQIDGRQVR